MGIELKRYKPGFILPGDNDDADDDDGTELAMIFGHIFCSVWIFNYIFSVNTHTHAHYLFCSTIGGIQHPYINPNTNFTIIIGAEEAGRTK